MELHETDYQLLKHMYENMDILEVSDQNEIILLNDIPAEKKYSLAVLCVTSDATLNEGEKNQLEKILAYLKETFETVPVFLCSKNEPVKFSQIASARKYEKLIVFGGSRVEQNVFVISPKEGHQPIQIGNITLFFTHPVSIIQNDEAKKRQLLAMLQQYILQK